MAKAQYFTADEALRLLLDELALENFGDCDDAAVVADDGGTDDCDMAEHEGDDDNNDESCQRDAGILAGEFFESGSKSDSGGSQSNAGADAGEDRASNDSEPQISNTLCGCKKKCLLKFDAGEIETMRLNCQDMQRDEHVVIGISSACRSDVGAKNRGKERKKEHF